MVQKPESDIEPRGRRTDLSLPQVAGSAVASVAAAVAASQLGVYGTILGAGVMSVVATCGGSVFQHFFRRTGEQIRGARVQANGAGRVRRVQDANGTRDEDDVREVWGARRAPGGPADATAVLRTVGTGPDRSRPLEPLDEDGTRLLKSPALDGTRLLTPYPAAPDEGFSVSTTHGTRIRGWKRSAVAAAAVFGVSMAGITAYELVSGGDLSGGQGTTVGSAVRGGPHGSGTADRAPSGSTGPEQGRDQNGATPGTDSQNGQSPSPDAVTSSPSTAGPSPTPSRSSGATDPAPAPTPAASADASPAPTGAVTDPGPEASATTGTDDGR
ncbi:hypothetical protein [Streptomyces sp. LN785]|uniref:hypothetical protein n=1 Tax=Streptomyces sp. LN785 TaxID=3112983 RepID=UPI003718731D